ncbi:MAG: TonB-dependent receptor [Verrucomicrobia bacterium]|nr:TonB-dependent receptor [Verrucomicrobiota bacterium]
MKPPAPGRARWRGPGARSLGLAAALVLVAFVPARAEAPLLLPPWVIAEAALRAPPTAREDWFAATLGSTTALAATDWSGRTVGTLSEALRRIPGLLLQESFGGFEPPRLSVRGSGLDSAPSARGVALLVDGLPLARADGSFHSGLFDPLLFARLEVYRGSLHAALTPAVLGGVINAATLAPTAASTSSLRLEGGDFGWWRAQAGTATPALGVEASFVSADGWREHSRQQRGALVASARRELRPGLQAEAAAYLGQADYEVPGPLTLAEVQSSPRSISPAARRDLPERDSSVVRVSGQIKAAAAGGTNRAAGMAWTRLRDTFRQLQPNGETAALSDDFAAHATAAWRPVVAGQDHHALVRTTISSGRLAVDRFRNDSARRGPRFGAYTGRAETAAVSVEDLAWLRPDLAVGAGGTALRARRRIEDRFTPTSPAVPLSRRVEVTEISPRAGVAWHGPREVTWRAAVSRGAEPPAFDDLVAVQGAYPNLGLRSRDLSGQRATTWELGVAGGGRRLAWSSTAYLGRWRQEILRLADANGLPRGAVNAGPTRHQGIESTLRWQVVEGPDDLVLAVTSTLGRFTFESDPVYGSNRIAGAPPHVGAAELAYAQRRGFFAAAEATWLAGRTQVDHAGRLAYGGHTLLHLRAGWRWGRTWQVYAAVRNLGDHAHVASTTGVLDLARAPAATSIFLPGAGRTFTVGCEWKR